MILSNRHEWHFAHGNDNIMEHVGNCVHFAEPSWNLSWLQ